MQPLVDNARSFPDWVARRPELFRDLAAGQAPMALFISCSDARVIPSLITGARPGDLFELRTAGNIVPPYDPDRPGGEAATIEYALCALRVRHIIVCGHSHCGAVGALVRGDDLAAMPTVRTWLQPTARELPVSHGVAHAVRRHAVAQLDALSRHPAVRDRLARDLLSLHAWYYEVDTGAVSAHAPRANGEFTPL
ncbi:carbonic anhydrase [Streptomyces sp. NPDC051907]|uniref:carbonic anhydrase n=1 Tax=Streptomyces sp. NPDC051907 TaxID=3155284 RepID=UPI003427D88E